MSTRSDLLQTIAADPVLSQVLSRAREAGEGDAAHDVEHLLRVARAAVRLGQGTVDAREAICAALLHDLVNLPKNHPERALASRHSAVAARSFLLGLGWEPASVERIAEAIEDHSYSGGGRPRSALGAVLQDADRLEALGAIGIARTFSTGVRLGASYFEPDDPWAERRPLADTRYSVDHFFTKLLRLPETLQTEGGRREAERRVALMKAFLAALGEEIGCPAPP